MDTSAKKQKYSLLSNFIYEYSKAWKFDKALVISMIFEILLGIVTPLFSAFITAFVVSQAEKKSEVLGVVAGIFGIFVVFGLIKAIQQYFSNNNNSEVIELRIKDYSMESTRKDMGLYLDVFENSQVKLIREQANRATQANGLGVEGFYHNSIPFFTKVFGLITYIGILGSLDPTILVLLLATSVVGIVIAYLPAKYAKHIEPYIAREQITMEYIERTGENAASGKDVRLYGLKNWISGKYLTAIKNTRRFDFPWAILRFLREGSDDVIGLARNLICYIYLIGCLKNGMSIGEFVFLIGLIGGFSRWIVTLARDYMGLLNDSFYISNFREYLDIDSKESKDSIDISQAKELDIEFKNVSFTYEGAGIPVVKNLSFKMKNGERLALVGVNGAGKTTIVKLISGLYLPDEGEILINGVDIRKINRKSYYKLQGAVFQNHFITSYSLAENVALSEEPDRDKVQMALEKAGLSERVSGLHKGIDTCLGNDIEEDGVSLSGGEIQKVLMARALYRDPKLVLLDEPTAAMDALAESAVYENYEKNLQGISTLFISHRLASTRFCDRILLLENGKITEEGTHEELMKKNGSYAEMFKVQSKYYSEKGEEA